jgi:hypothetical protein
MDNNKIGIRKDTINLILRGFGTLDIVNEMQKKYDLLGPTIERDLMIEINKLRTEIIEFTRVAPGIAESAFNEGLEWREVLATLDREGNGVLGTWELVQIASAARTRLGMV